MSNAKSPTLPSLLTLLTRTTSHTHISSSMSFLRTATLRRASAAPMSLRSAGARLAVRSLATEAQDTRPQVKAATINPSLSATTVEELHSRTAEEILAEGGNRKEASMRHFTINFG